MDNFEIERKFLISYPDDKLIKSCTDITDILQTYLIPEKSGTTERVRKRGSDNNWTYTHTVKKRISDVRRIELEDEIGEDEYKTLMRRADPERRSVTKKRVLYYYQNQMFEIDLYPFWSDRAVMELEIEDESQKIIFPPDINVIKEISGDKRYTNASIARKIPEDDI